MDNNNMAGVRIRRGVELKRQMDAKDMSSPELQSKLKAYGYDAALTTVYAWQNGASGIPVDNPEFNLALMQIFNLTWTDYSRTFELAPEHVTRTERSLEDQQFMDALHRGLVDDLIAMLLERFRGKTGK